VFLSAIYSLSSIAVPRISGAEETKINALTLPPVGKFNENLKTLADQLDRNAINKDLSRVFIVSFTNLDKLEAQRQ
jgi:hypothetical protein